MPLPKSLKLESSDGEIITVDTETIRQSNTINNMINDLEDQGFSEDDPIPVNNVNGNILNKVIEWCKQHKNDANTPEDDDNDKRTDDIPAWDQEFLKCDQGTLFELIMAANFLDIKKLLDLCCKSVANMIKGKSANEIRKTFNIKNDFNEDEEAQVRKENTWCEKE